MFLDGHAFKGFLSDIFFCGAMNEPNIGEVAL